VLSARAGWRWIVIQREQGAFGASRVALDCDPARTRCFRRE
jgi:hypothetical protein